MKNKKTKRFNVYFICHKKEKKGKKQTTTSDNPTTISRHVSLHVEEDTVAHLEI